MANLIDTEYTPIEGVHTLSDSSYRKHVRTLPVLTCESCGKRNGQNGVEVKRCQGVRRRTIPFRISEIYLSCSAGRLDSARRRSACSSGVKGDVFT